MSYTSKEQQERQKWMLLKEAISRIKRVDTCDEKKAYEQLFAALADGEIEYSRQLTGAPVPFVKREERAEFWRSVRIDKSGQNIYWHDFGEVFNDDDHDDDDDDIDVSGVKHVSHPIDRVWILKKSIDKYWNDQVQESIDKDEKRASDDEMRAALREIYKNAKEASKKIPNVLQSYDLLAEAVAPKTATRKYARPIVEEPEFANQRLGQGERPPKK